MKPYSWLQFNFIICSYYGKYKNGAEIISDCVKYISELDLDECFVGETKVIGKEEEEIDIIENMFLLRDEKEVNDIDSVKAIYLKD